jgi:hypothetical protein
VDIAVYLQVLRRHWVVLLCGLAAGIAFTALTAFNINAFPPKLSWKLQPTFGATSMVLVTQAGDPLGRTINETSAPNSTSSRFVDPSRFTYLASLYSQLATGDSIMNAVVGKDGWRYHGTLYLDGGKVAGSYSATTVGDPSGQGSLPFVQITSTAATPAAATEIGQRATDALVSYVTSQQNAAGVSTDERVVLTVTQAPTHASQVKGRGLVLPLVIFLFCIFGAVAFAFFIENLKSEDKADRSETETSATVHSVAGARSQSGVIAPTTATAHLGRRGTG